MERYTNQSPEHIEYYNSKWWLVAMKGELHRTPTLPRAIIYTEINLHHMEIPNIPPLFLTPPPYPFSILEVIT
jgi:hypothetical protein